jgi:hypothetical protein
MSCYRRKVSQVPANNNEVVAEVQKIGIGEWLPTAAESARGISPRAAHRAGRESLDSSGSCHP